MACSMECLDFMEKCYRAEEYKPPVLSFDLFEKIGRDVEVARNKHKFNQVLTIIDSVNKDNLWKEIVSSSNDCYEDMNIEEDPEYEDIWSMSQTDRITWVADHGPPQECAEMSRAFVTYLNDRWGQSIWFNKQYSDYEITWAWCSHDPNSGRAPSSEKFEIRGPLPPNIYYYTPQFKYYNLF